MLICPVCGAPLIADDRLVFCENGHRFDKAKEGYVNLLRSNKSGALMGDDKLAARSRRDFLNKGYYSLLRDGLMSLFRDKTGTLLDICCGEGYYTSALAAIDGLDVYGFDISKEMIRLAAKRGGATCFVANLAAIPMSSGSVDYAIHLFAPFQEKEFSRVLNRGGRLYSVVPGARHLWGLKETLYETPYLNDEKLPQTESLLLSGTTKLSGKILLRSQEDIQAVFRMTPYYFHTSPADKNKLEGLDHLETEIEFVIGEYTKE